MDPTTNALTEVGTLYVTPNGDAYRLRDYSVDWKAEPFTGEATVPSYSVQFATGSNTNAYELPKDAVLAWSPTTGISQDAGRD